MKGLRLVLWNANGLLSRKNELEIFLTDNEIDVALLTETHLTRNIQFNIPTYITYRTDHPSNRARGGALILVKSSINHHFNGSKVNESIQCTSIKVGMLHFEVAIAAVYCPPGSNLTKPILDDTLLSFGPRFMCGGDYNAKNQLWGSRTTNSRGRTLENALTGNNYKFLSPASPTYWPTDVNRIPDVLDFFITKGLDFQHFDLTTLTDLSSDHSPLLLTMDTQPIIKMSRPTLTPGQTDWCKFRASIVNSISLNLLIRTPEDLDNAVDLLTKTVQNAAWDSSVSSNKTENRQTKYHVPPHIRQLIEQKRKARKIWQRTRYPTDKHKFNKLTRKLHDEIRRTKTEKFDNFLNSLVSSDKTLWNMTKRVLNHHDVSHPVRQPDGSWAKTSRQKAETFACHLEKTFQPHSDINDQPTNELVLHQLNVPLQMTSPPKAIHPLEVRIFIDKLANNKAPGYDLISNYILKNLPWKAILFLTNIYNSILRITYFPAVWKYSEVVMILKPNKPPDCLNSYRPISLLSSFSKLFEKILLHRLNSLEILKVIPNHQFGFRKHHSTIQQCHRLVDYISSALESKNYCPGVFLDVGS